MQTETFPRPFLERLSLLTNHSFYTYDAKYIDKDGAGVIVPANLPAKTAELVQDRSKEVFRALGCEGMARVDFFLTELGELLVNEVNTLPGFTNISMYPKVFAASGIPGVQLVTLLIEHALERSREK